MRFDCKHDAIIYVCVRVICKCHIVYYITPSIYGLGTLMCVACLWSIRSWGLRDRVVLIALCDAKVELARATAAAHRECVYLKTI